DADAVIPLNRVKSHARFVGDYESGLLKMLIVGLGKREGAAAVHRFCRATIDPLVRAAAPVILGRLRVPFGLAVIENAQHQVAQVRAVAGQNLLAEEPEILRLAKRLLPRLPVAEVDLLVVDRIGKDVSGTGMETFVIGQRPDSPTRVNAIVALDLTEATAGNAHGVGFAIYTTQRLWDKVDHAATRANAMTAQRPEGARLPIPLPTDREAVLAGLELAGGPEARVVHILDTANLTRFHASAALWDELAAAPHVQAIGAPFDMPFDAAGRLRAVECPGAR
ncbi:MAG TPA: hypothetical protein P5137_06060, partial [Candidatus Brocadiia bacterium]|nr:hypothetical protein [Candidatus Brocadiia bacterium]